MSLIQSSFCWIKESESDSEPAPIKNSSVDFESTLDCWPIREANNGHVTYLIGQLLGVKIYARIFCRIGTWRQFHEPEVEREIHLNRNFS